MYVFIVMAKLEQFILYETKTTMYLVGSDNLQVSPSSAHQATIAQGLGLVAYKYLFLLLCLSLQNQYRIMLMDKTQKVNHRTPLADIVREASNGLLNTLIIDA